MESKKYCYDYPRAAMTSDCVIFGFKEHRLMVLLIERAHEPFKGCFAFPGGFLDMDETSVECAARELREETGISCEELFEVGIFSRVDRDPRGRTLSVAYYGIADIGAQIPVAGDDASTATWHDVYNLPLLAFDHQDIIDRALHCFRKDLSLRPIIHKWFPPLFGMADIKLFYDVVLNRQLELSGFGNELINSGLFVDKGSGLFSFNNHKFETTPQHSVCYFVG